MKTQIKELQDTFKNYIKLLNALRNISKAEINDLYTIEESLRNDIKQKLDKLKEEF